MQGKRLIMKEKEEARLNELKKIDEREKEFNFNNSCI